MSDKKIIENKTPPSPENPAVEEMLSPEQLAGPALAELKEQATRAAQYQDQMLRTAADLENYKKRAARERQEAIKYAQESLLEKLIPVLDNFDMALAAASAPNTSVPSLQAGITMIQQQLKSAMADAGLEEIDARGQAFDPNLHEALSHQETTEVPEGHVAQQVRKGYKLRARLLRPASVLVAKAPAR